MRVITGAELHPEELLAALSQRELAPEEQADLDAHLARCTVCLLQFQMRDELARELAPAEADYVLSARVMKRLSEPAGIVVLEGPRPARRQRWGARAAVAIATLMFLGGAGAAGSAILNGWRPFVRAKPPRVALVLPPVRTTRPRAIHGAVAVSEVEAATAPAEPPAPAPQAPAPVTASPHDLGLHKTTHTPAEATDHPTHVAIENVAALALPSAPDAASLFSAATHARDQHQAQEAEDLFNQLSQRFPGTREEIAARVLRAQLLLDELDEPARALALFDVYLRDQAQGFLWQEALVGRAQALERLGDLTQARDAWSQLLARAPASVHAGLARRHLATAGDSGH